MRRMIFWASELALFIEPKEVKHVSSAIVNTMFGWVDFRKDGKCKKENIVENWVSLCLGIGRKQGEWKIKKKNFSPGPTNIFLPNREEKPEEKMLSWPFYHNALWNQVKKKKERESTLVKHKIDGALNQNTNSNQNFKTNQIITQKQKNKKKKSKADQSQWKEDMQWCFLNALE